MGREIKRTGFTRRTGRLRAVSDKRRKLNKKRKPVVDAVFERDGHRCRAENLGIGNCFGPLTPHETMNRERAGRTDANLLDADNMLSLCAFHNTWVEDNPPKALELGLARNSWAKTVVTDAWCDECLFAWPDIALTTDGDYAEGRCPEGHRIELTFEEDDRL